MTNKEYWQEQSRKHAEHRKWLKQQQANKTNYKDLFTEEFNRISREKSQ